MNSFLTGSQVYGVPHDKSDVDLVIVANTETLRKLWALSERDDKLVFGNLNLVTFNSDDCEQMCRYHRWKQVTDNLCLCAPVTKEKAIKAFREAGAENNYVEQRVNVDFDL